MEQQLILTSLYEKSYKLEESNLNDSSSASRRVRFLVLMNSSKDICLEEDFTIPIINSQRGFVSGKKHDKYIICNKNIKGTSNVNKHTL